MEESSLHRVVMGNSQVMRCLGAGIPHHRRVLGTRSEHWAELVATATAVFVLLTHIEFSKFPKYEMDKSQ
jgi:hypothetical protein